MNRRDWDVRPYGWNSHVLSQQITHRLKWEPTYRTSVQETLEKQLVINTCRFGGGEDNKWAIKQERVGRSNAKALLTTSPKSRQWVQTYWEISQTSLVKCAS